MSYRVTSGWILAVAAAVTSAFCLAGAVHAADYTFNINQSTSSLNAAVTIRYGIFTVGPQSASSNVTGTMNASLNPGTEPFSNIHVTGLDLSLASTLNYVFSIPFVGSENVSASNVSLSLSPGNAGPQTSVAGNGSFTQNNNVFKANAHIVATGSVANVTQNVINQPTDPQPLGGSITQSGDTLSLHLSINQSVNDIDLGGSGATADIVFTGNVYGTATIIPEPTSMAVILLGGLGLLRRRRHAA